MTYSMCCQRPSSRLRLPTFVLPETAPTSGEWNACTSCASVRGSKTVSASTMTTMSWRASAIPWFSAAGLPAFGWRSTLTRPSPSPATRSPVPSTEPSSTTITSSSG